jgi:hypothetical protein
MEKIEKLTVEQVLEHKGKNLNIHYVIRCLSLKEANRTRNWNGVKYNTIEEWFYANCV